MRIVGGTKQNRNCLDIFLHSSVNTKKSFDMKFFAVLFGYLSASESLPSYSLVKEFFHDDNSYTQGLTLHNGLLYGI